MGRPWSAGAAGGGPRGPWAAGPWPPGGRVSWLPAWFPAVPLAVVALVLQLGGAFGRAHREGTVVGWPASLLLVVGPLAVATLSRFPLVPLAVSIVAALGYVLVGDGVGPVFAAPVAALLVEGARRRRERLVARWEERRARAETARTDERMAMARDLHDALGHSLTLINVQAGAALHTFDRDPENARQVLTTVKAESHRALEEVRRVLDAVRDPGAAAQVRPGPSLAGVAELVHADPGFAWTLDVDLGSAPLPAAVDAAAYRVVQEAMTNVRRHSRATSARIAVSRSATGIQVLVEDPGPATAPARDAADPSGPGGTGIVGMRERVERLGGTLETGPRATGGWRVAAALPIAGTGEPS